MALGPSEKQFVITTAKEILIKALETSNPFSAAFSVENANELGDVFKALVTKVAQSLNSR